MILGRYTKQPADISDYDLDCSEWLRDGETLTPATAVVACTSTPLDAEMAVSSVTTSPDAVRVRLTGGTAGQLYKATVTVTTTSGRREQTEFVIECREF